MRYADGKRFTGYHGYCPRGRMSLFRFSARCILMSVYFCAGGLDFREDMVQVARKKRERDDGMIGYSATFKMNSIF